MRHETKTTLVLGLALLLTAATWAQTPINERRPATPGGTVEVENVAGSVEVTGWSNGELEVTGTLWRGAERLEITGGPDALRVKVVLPQNIRQTEDTHLKIRMPNGSRLQVEGVSASVEVRDVTGRLDLESVSGDVTVHGRPEALEAQSVSGDVTVEEAPAGADLASVSGNVTVGRASDELEAASVSGDVVVSAGSLGRAELSTTSGDIRCAVDLSGAGTVEMETMSGSILLEVPSSVGGDFELSTFSGSISSDLGPAPERTSKYTPGEELKFSLGSGPRVKASSFSGSVTLKTR